MQGVTRFAKTFRGDALLNRIADSRAWEEKQKKERGGIKGQTAGG